MKLKTVRELRGIGVARNSPTLTHIFFANDSIIFCGATTNEWLQVQKVLRVYKAAIGQGIKQAQIRAIF